MWLRGRGRRSGAATSPYQPGRRSSGGRTQSGLTALPAAAAEEAAGGRAEAEAETAEAVSRGRGSRGRLEVEEEKALLSHELGDYIGDYWDVGFSFHLLRSNGQCYHYRSIQ